MNVDWKDPKSKISKHFFVREALWLPAWEVFHVPSEQEKAEILKTAEKMDLVREYLERPLIIHCWIRPKVANIPNSKWDKKNYNSFVGGAPGSAHPEGKAADFNPVSMTCGEARSLLLHKLKEFDIRLENTEGNWLHIDTRQPLPMKSRFFRP
jgi:zinc D-Ala-D-Ala carboxypeptidase